MLKLLRSQKAPKARRITSLLSKTKLLLLAVFLTGISCFFYNRFQNRHTVLVLQSSSISSAKPGAYIPKQNEFTVWNDHQMLARYVRAFRERGIREGIFWTFEDQPLGPQLERFQRLKASLASRRIFLDGTKNPVSSSSSFVLWLRRLLALFLAVLIPLIVYGMRQKKANPVLCFIISLGAGSAIWFILGAPEFQGQSKSLYIIQLAFLLPFAVAVWRERRDLSRAVIVTTVILASISLLRLAQALPVPGWENAVRDWMDVEIGLRPRIKEVVGWFLWALPAAEWPLAALLGPVSTMNSFLHAHTPLSHILARSCAGFLMAYGLSLISWGKIFGNWARGDVKAALAGYFKKGNFGDDWVLQSKVRELVDSGMDHREIILWRHARPNFLAGRPDKAYFLGGLLQDYSSGRSFLYYLVNLALASMWAREEAVYCGSLGPIERPLSRRLFALFLHSSLGNRVRFELRDTESAQLLVSLCRRARFDVRYDPALITPLPIERPQRRLKGKAKLAFLINGTLKGARWGNFWREALDEWRGRAEVTLFISDSKRDWKLAVRLAHLAPEVQIKIYEGNTMDFLSALSQYDAAVSQRLHGAIACVRLGVPVAYPELGGLEKFRLEIPLGVASFLVIRQPYEIESLFQAQSSPGILETGMVS